MLAEFADLFEGRRDAYGTEEGGCVRAEHLGDGGDWPTMVKTHLLGAYPIGVYPLVPYWETMSSDDAAWLVKWGCVDFDVAAPGKRAYDFDTEADAHVAATNLVRVLERCGVTGWIEVTRSHGRHVWVFADEWVPAYVMRRALLVACQVAGVPTREVNPKSEGFPDPSALGNYVRLPYPGGAQAVELDNRYMLARDLVTPMASHAFVSHAHTSRTRREMLEPLAAAWQPPPEPKVEIEPYQGTGLGHLLHRIGKPARAVFYEGPMDGDRSEGLFYLAGACKDGGLTPGEALTVITDADARWGKFSKRRDGERQLQRTIERAYR